MNFLKRMAPCFSIHESNIKILREPCDFYQYLKLKARSCKKRIIIASLYLGSGEKEKSLVDAIFNSIKSNQDNKNFRVHILLDSTRGSRLVKDHHGRNSSSRSMCLPLLNHRNNQSDIKVSFYHTPNLRGWSYKLLPEKWNEVIGLQHMKIYLFDDCLLMSGANLSEDYFTNRQDRYIVFENSPLLCDFYEDLVDIVGSRSYRMNSTNELESPKMCCDPITGDFNEYILEFHKAVENFISHQMVKSQQREESALNTSTRVYPLIQMGLYGVVQDQMVLTRLLKSLSHDSNSEGNTVSLASGYFNLDKQNEDNLLQMAGKNISLEILTASPEANGFFKARGLMKYIPDVYTDILEQFELKVRDLPIRTVEWKRDHWTFHAKGFWISKLIFNSPRVFVTLIGSTNYGHRSCSRDLESELLIETSSDRLAQDLLQEKAYLFSHGKCRERYPPHKTIIPAWLHWVVPAVRYFF